MANVEMNELHQNKKFQTGVSIATFGAALMSRIALAGGAEQLFGKKKSRGYDALLAKITTVCAIIYIVISLAIVAIFN